MKVIDLLNKIANGEEVPEKIRYREEYYSWYKCGYNREPIDKKGSNTHLVLCDLDLNDEVKVIKNKTIEPIDIDLMKKDFKTTQNEIILGYKINEIIDKVNKGE